MACEISEFMTRHVDQGGAVEILRRPCLAVQPPLAIGAAARSAAFNAGTLVLRIVLSADVRIRIGGSAVTAIADGSDGASEFFPAGEHYLGVTPGQFLSVIAATSA